MHEDRSLRLKLLQDELLSIKQHYGKDATLRKIAPPGAAFPVLLKMHVEPPPFVTARYDVSMAEVVLTLSPSILCAPPYAKVQTPEGHLSIPADLPDHPTMTTTVTSQGSSGAGTTKTAAAAAAAAAAEKEERGIRQGGEQNGDNSRTRTFAPDMEGGWQKSLTVDVRCAELPKELRARIAARLHAHWVARVQVPNQTGLALELPAEVMHAQFLSLITMMSELVEGYESVDASGATVRRFLIVGQQQEEVNLTAPTSHPPKSATRDSSAAQSGTPHTQSASKPPSVRPQHSNGVNNSHAARDPSKCGTHNQPELQAHRSDPRASCRYAGHAEVARRAGRTRGMEHVHIQSKGTSDHVSSQHQTPSNQVPAGGHRRTQHEAVQGAGAAVVEGVAGSHSGHQKHRVQAGRDTAGSGKPVHGVQAGEMQEAGQTRGVVWKSEAAEGAVLVQGGYGSEGLEMGAAGLAQDGAGSVQGPGERVSVEGGGHGVAMAARVLWGELQYLQRRFGAAFRMVQCGDGERGREGRRMGCLQEVAENPGGLSSCSGFELELQPTDPAWERGPVTLLCELTPATSQPASTGLQEQKGLQSNRLTASPQPASTQPPALGAMARQHMGLSACAAAPTDGTAQVKSVHGTHGSVRGVEQGLGRGQMSHAAMHQQASPQNPQAHPQATQLQITQLQAEGMEGRADAREAVQSSRDGAGGEADMLLLSLCISSATPLPLWLRSHFDKALAKQICSPAVALPMGLRCILRQLENYGGQLAMQAEQAARATGVRTNLGQGTHTRDASSSNSSSSKGSVAIHADSKGRDSKGGENDEGEEGFATVGEPSSDEDGCSSSGSSDGSEGSWYGDLGGVKREDGGEMGQSLSSQASVLGNKHGSVTDTHFTDQFENGGGKKQRGAEVEEQRRHAGAACAFADDGGQEEEENRDEVMFRGGGGEGESAEGGMAEVAAFHLVLEALKLDLISAVEALKAVIQVRCSRCSTPSVLCLSSDAVATSGTEGPSTSKAPFQASSPCQNCRSTFQASIRTKFVHDTSNVLLVLKPIGCYPLDLLPSLLAAQCSCCSAVMSLRNVQVGMPYERTCSSCHQRLSLHMPAVSFVPISQGPKGVGSNSNKGNPAVNSRMAMAAAKKGGLRGALAAFNGVLQLGQPLPGLGTCKHYHHSHRWLRFPCCGMRYPCDLCHEELSADGHGVRWAQRMVCGYCSVEQALGSQCKNCGKKLASSAKNPSGRNTRYWEGGEGCRDKTRMTRSDPHKYRDSKAKTRSKKQSRVGEKPWSKMKKNEQKTHYQSSK